MRKQLIIGLYTEGPTDIRFLTSIIKRTFEEVSYECQGDLEILDIQHISVDKSRFVEEAVKVSSKGFNDFGITILCVHADADNASDVNCFNDKINPAICVIEESQMQLCKVIVPVVPVRMTEAWMLADKELLKKEIGTDKSNQKLGIHKDPEQYADPKEVIVNAIRIARQEETRRRRHELKISELYLTLGQTVKLDALKRLPSYLKFQNNVREALKKLNYLH